MSRLARVLLTLLFALPLLAACGPGFGSGGDQGYVDATGVIAQIPEAERKRPGPVEGESLDGTSLSLASYAGQTVVLNVWGSWCPPCRAEAGDLAAASRELAGDGVVFLGINTRDASVDKPLAFERKYDVPYPSIFDPGGRTLLAFRGLVRPSVMIPTTIVIDPQGRVAASIIDRISSRQTLVDLVRDVQGTVS